MMRRAASPSSIAPELIFYGGVLLISLVFVAAAAGLGGCTATNPEYLGSVPPPASVVDGGGKDAAPVCRPCIFGQPLPGQTCTETLCGCVGIPDGGMHCCCKEAK